ncbi:MAG: hypothetical protein VZR32_08625, partial [Candidatus Weimeria sp.]|nr:hypothetical protein [Candidatus Weimeria sp.]
SANGAVDKGLVISAEKYLNSITGLYGDFLQKSNGKSERGTFSMLRPGRVRLDYKNAPIQLKWCEDAYNVIFVETRLQDTAGSLFSIRFPPNPFGP